MPQLASKETCTGCAACGNICPHDAITLRPNEEGFLQPSVNPEKCVECKLCEKACPIVNGKDLKHPEVTQVYALWDNRTRTESSSGGAFSAFARGVLDKGGVVFGAAWTDEFTCGHIECTSAEELSRLRGSKYVQSDINNTFKAAKAALTEGKPVLFTGTPCQIAGLRSFLLKPYPNLLTIDIVCHGVPSNVLFKNYISKLKAEYPQYREATGFSFRNLKGWGLQPGVLLQDKSMKHLSGIPNLYMHGFNRGMIFRESCYDCHFNGLSRVGDLTIADFWGLGRQGTPFGHNQTQGVSLVLANSEAGRQALGELKDCFIEPRAVEEAIPYNHNLVASTKLSPDREALIAAFNNPELTLKEISNSFHLTNKTLKGRIKSLLKKSGLFWPVKSLIEKIRAL